MKRIGILCFLISLILVVVFHQAIFTFFANWSLQAYSVSKWGRPLKYEKIYLAGDQLVIVHPQLENEVSFAAEQIRLNVHFNLWKRDLYLDIAVEQPHWHMQNPPSSQWQNWQKLFSQEKKWFKTHSNLHINNGSLTWGFADTIQQLHFDLNTNSQEGGFVKLYFNPQDLSTDCLTLQALSIAQKMEVNCTCQQVSCSSLSALTSFFEMDFPWLVTHGFLEGQVKAIFPGARRPYVEGELFVENLAFHHTQTGLKGQIEKACLKLEKNQMAYELKDQVPTFIGQFNILKSASLIYTSPTQEWAIHQIEGSVQLNNIETAFINLKAQENNSSHPSYWTLQGEANLNAQRSLNLDLNLFCSSAGEPKGNIHLSFHQLQKGYKQAQVQLENVSYQECDFLQTLLATYWPIFHEVKLEQGELTACIEADVTDQGIGEVRIQQFQAFHLRSRLHPWHAKCDFSQVKGHGKIDLGKEDVWQSIYAGLHLEDGEIHFEGISPHLPLTDIQAHLLIQQGHVEHSLVTLQLAGLKGNMDVEWGDHKQLLIFKLDGVVEDLAGLLPQTLQEGLREQFYHNRLMVLANIKRQNRQVELAGTLHIERAETQQMDLIHFGCELKKISKGPFPKFVPVGWFYGHHLPLEKFLSPFIFRNGILQMKGEGEFKGAFDDQILTIKYDAENLKIENDDLCIEVKELHSAVPGQLVGSHQFDLKTHSHQGTLPIQQASYFEKNSGLFFHEIQGIVNFKDQIIRILPIEAYCEGVYFAGNLELDYSDPAPGVFELKIHCPTLVGKVSQIQHLLAHLDQPSLLHKIPLEGEVSAKEQGLILDFTFVPKDYTLQAEVKGTVTDGALSFEDADMSLKGIYMDVDYHHQQQLLEFSDLQGTLLVGKPRRVEEYLFVGDHVRLYNIVNPDIEVDIAVYDKEHELLRLVGYTEEEQENVRRLHLNQTISHISCIYPQVWQCCLKDWSHLEQFEFDSTFDLGSFLEDINRFRQTGLFFLSYHMLDKLSHFLPIEGKGSCAIRYHPDQSLTYQLEGLHIKRGNSVEHHGFLKGSKQDKKWIIDQLQWDDLNAYAELQQTSDKWRIPFLGLSAGQTLLLGMDGDFNPQEGSLRAKLNFCDVNLAKLDRWEAFQPFMLKWWPKGYLKATGNLEWILLSSNLWEGLKVSLEAQADHLSFRNYPLQLSQPFHIDIQAKHSFRLQDVKCELYSHNNQAYVDLKQFEYCPSQDYVRNLQLNFQVPSQDVEEVGESLHHHFPDFFNASVKDMLISSKPQGQLKGALLMESQSPSQNSLRLSLNDGIYRFKKREYDLKQFEIQIAGDEMQFSAVSQYERCPFHLIGQVQWPSCQQGACQLMALQDATKKSQPLIVKWENHPQKGAIIRSMKGEFSGSSFFLSEDKESLPDSEWTALQGQVSLNFNRLCPLLPLSMADAIQKLKMDSSYVLAGHLWINSDLGDSLLDTLSFKGVVTSQEAILKGYQFQHLQADLQYVPGRLDLQNLFIQDPAGNVKAAHLIATWDRRKDQWTLFIPRLIVKNLRMGLLRDTESSHAPTNPKFRSLIVKRVDLQDFSGELGNQQTWQAQGTLHFLNPSRKNFFHPLLAIPAEIILRLGLDPHVLNPVTGIIYFTLQGDRFYLTRFKDVYSEGRGSKFYLAQSSQPSWMDFDGNLSVQVRMKQYNLIFKIAELFTVSIQGNIKKPRYTLQKQSKTSHKGQTLPILSESF